MCTVGLLGWKYWPERWHAINNEANVRKSSSVFGTDDTNMTKYPINGNECSRLMHELRMSDCTNSVLWARSDSTNRRPIIRRLWMCRLWELTTETSFQIMHSHHHHRRRRRRRRRHSPLLSSHKHIAMNSVCTVIFVGVFGFGMKHMRLSLATAFNYTIIWYGYDIWCILWLVSSFAYNLLYTNNSIRCIIFRCVVAFRSWCDAFII